MIFSARFQFPNFCTFSISEFLHDQVKNMAIPNPIPTSLFGGSSGSSGNSAFDSLVGLKTPSTPSTGDNIFQGPTKEANYAAIGQTPKAKNPAFDAIKDLSAYNAGLAGNNAQFQGAYVQPHLQSTFEDLIKSLTQSNYQNQANRAYNSVQGAYGQQARNQALASRRMGMGDATGLGQMNALNSLATRQASSAAESYLDPRRRQQDLMQALQILFSGTNNPYQDQLLQQMMALDSHYASQPKKPSGIGGILGTIAGGLAGGPIGGAIGNWLGGQLTGSQANTGGADPLVRPGSFARRA